MSAVFISYNRHDKLQAQWLAKYLEKSGASVWLDEADLKIGYSLIDEISRAIEHTDFVAAILSSYSLKSAWVQKELSLAMTKEIEGRKVVVLPIKIDDCKLPAFLIDKLYADLSSTANFQSELKRIAQAVGVRSTDWPDLDRMYSGEGWQTILMVQTFADRREWGGPAYHCVNPRRRLRRILKVYGGYKHPIGEPAATQFIRNAIKNIKDLDPDVLGLGGMGETSSKIRWALREQGYGGKIDYWGSDPGKDACAFLREYGVSSSEW